MQRLAVPSFFIWYNNLTHLNVISPRGRMITRGIVIIAVSAMILFSVQNATPVVVSFLSWKVGASLAALTIPFILIGILIGETTASFWQLQRLIKKTMAPTTMERNH